MNVNVGEEEVKTVGQTRVTPVAVIGIACRAPGAGDDPITEAPANRWHADEYYHPESAIPGRSADRWGASLRDVANFDPEFFGITCCGVGPAVLPPDPICGSVEAPMTTVRGSRTSSGDLTGRDLLRDLEGKWSE